MKDVAGIFAVVCVFLMSRVGGIEPNSGYCIGNQCFSVTKDLGDFWTARSQCGGLGGHLMTVRSSVSHDVLVILLGNVTGRFWIGLHLTGNCPDTSAELKGFLWETGGNESDYSNWATTFDSNCSSHRCVSVSREDDFKWNQEPCDKHVAGFLCEFTFSETCKGLEAAEFESISYTTTIGFVGEDLLSLPPGTVAVRMPHETKYMCYLEQWMQAPWNCEVMEGGCEYKCVIDPKNVTRCYCPPGQIVNPVNKVACVEAQDDPCVSLRCAHICYNNGGTYACMCTQGYKLASDGRSCLDFNDCRDARQCPGENFMCVNTVGGFQCVCKDGYRKIGGRCVDVDECAPAPCEHMCENAPGSYKCSCYSGYKEDPADPHRCKLHCGEQECDAECDPNDFAVCYCPAGYILEERDTDRVCIDMDECFSFFCDQGCENTYGSYVCMCNPGYTLDEQNKCVKTDEPDTDGGSEGSGSTSTHPSIVTASAVPPPDPTRQPSAVTTGALVGIIVCTVFFVVLVVFLAHQFVTGRGKMERASGLKAPENEAHSLQPVTSDA